MIYSGTDCVGFLEEGASVVVRDLDGAQIGIFPDRKRALAAFFARQAVEGTLLVKER